MDRGGKESGDRLHALLARGDELVESLGSLSIAAGTSREAFLADAKPLFDEVDAVVEKMAIGDVVRPALDHLARGWLGALDREVRFFEVLAELQAIHEELFAIVAKDDT